MSATIALLGVGFSLGFMHALDADHVMAVSSLSNKRPGLTKMLRFCAHWALGHGSILLLCGVILFGLGWQIPSVLQQSAELLVGLLLIVLGLWFFWQFKRKNITLEQHTHDDIAHYHLHVAGDVTKHGHKHSSKKDGHMPVMVGVLHGLAGSAPALALVPAVSQGDIYLALGYLMIFSLGVMLSMLIFGLGFGSLQQFLQKKYLKVFRLQQYLIASFSILLGSFWLTQAI